MIKSLLILGVLLVSLSLAQTVNYIQLMNEGTVRSSVTDGTYTYIGTFTGAVIKFVNADLSRAGPVFYPTGPQRMVLNMTMSATNDAVFVAYMGDTVLVRKIKISDMTLLASVETDISMTNAYGASLYADASYVYGVSGIYSTTEQTMKWYSASTLKYVGSLDLNGNSVIGLANNRMLLSTTDGIKKFDASTSTSITTPLNWAQFGAVQSHLLLGSKLYMITEGSGALDHVFVTIDTDTNAVTSTNIGDLLIDNTSLAHSTTIPREQQHSS